MNPPFVTFVTGSNVVWGAEISLLTIASRMRVSSRLLASNPDLVDRWRSEVPQGVAAVVAARRGRVARNLAFITAIARASSQTSVIVVFDFYLMPSIVVLRPLLALRGVRVVVDVHDAVDRNPRRRPYFWLFRFADHAIAISKYVLRQLPRGLPSTLVYRPVARLPSVPDPGRSAMPVVGIVGQVSSDKGVLDGLRAIHSAGVPCRVVVRGAAADSTYEDDVRRAGEGWFGDRFRYEGRVPRESTMAGLDVLVVTNAGEPFGRVAVEAQLSGVIVVGPNEGGAAEIVDHGVTGFQFNPSDSSSLAACISAAVRERTSSTGMADRARQQAELRFDAEAQSREYEDALKRAVTH